MKKFKPFKKLQEFFQIYWRHVKSLIDLTLFGLGVFGFVLEGQINVYYYGREIIFVAVVVAFYRTWLYEHRRRLQLESESKRLQLSDIQKDVLVKLKNSDNENVNVRRSTAGTSILAGGKELPAEEHDFSGQEAAAHLSDLADKGILRLHKTSKSGDPIYKLERRGYKIMEEIHE